MFWGLWTHFIKEGNVNYFKAYITKLNGTHVDFALKVNKGQTRSYPRTKSVLIIDKIPEMKDITVNAQVIAQHKDDQRGWYRTGIVKGTQGSAHVSVKFDNGEFKWVRLGNLRLVKRPRFCVDNI